MGNGEKIQNAGKGQKEQNVRKGQKGQKWGFATGTDIYVEMTHRAAPLRVRASYHPALCKLLARITSSLSFIKDATSQGRHVCCWTNAQHGVSPLIRLGESAKLSIQPPLMSGRIHCTPIHGLDRISRCKNPVLERVISGYLGAEQLMCRTCRGRWWLSGRMRAQDATRLR